MNERSKPSFLRQPRTLAIAALVLIAGGGWYFWHKHKLNAAAAGEYIFAKVERGDIEDLVTATGALQPRDYVDVGAQVSGQVEKIAVEVGDEVKKGQPLVEIDATQSEARVEANRANLRSQESQLLDRQNSLTKAERDYQRQVNLKKEDATTDEAMQNAETTLNSARQAIATLKAQIEQQKATMRVEETNLKYTKIVAPIDGTVVSIAAKMGQTINATQQAPTLLRIADLSTMTVQTQVSEADVSKLNKGMRAYFTTLGSQTRRWYGTLSRIEPTPTVQNSVVLYNALFEVKNEGSALLPSMTAQVFFVRAEARNVLVVPMAALQQGQQILRAQEEKNKDKKAAPEAAKKSPAAQNAAADAAKPGDASGPGATAAASNSPPAGGPPSGDNPGRANGAGGNGGNRQGGGGGFGGFNGGNPPTPEQIEQFRRMREQRAAQGGGGGGFGGGGFGGQRQNGAVRQRKGTVMVKGADGKLVARDVVIGVTNRVHGEVLSGLQEGDEVVAGRHEAEAAAASGQNNRQNNNGFPAGGFPGGGFPGGGFPGGGGGNRGGGR
ncbi:MAG TPA: efflux RND transporter periplasmic adaptor subunit [Steroidobacteraceae bacterium]|nr:efflux RND transporter periplasmic adaptor subunit [Steroidobacteraceae bacterium]